MRLILQLVLLLLLIQCFGGAAAFRASPHRTSSTTRKTTTARPAARRTAAAQPPKPKWVSGNRSSSSRTGLVMLVPAASRIITPATQLAAFLPPSGGGGGGDNGDRSGDGLGAVATSVLTFAGITLFFLSPLGGLFFAVFNSLLALAILIPVGGFVAFQVWTYLNTVQGNCANCGAPVQVMKDGTPSICLSCGSIVQAKDGEIYLANPNARRDIFVDDENVAPMGGWINGQGSSLGGRTETRRTTSTTIIDVDVKLDDD